MLGVIALCIVVVFLASKVARCHARTCAAMQEAVVECDEYLKLRHPARLHILTSKGWGTFQLFVKHPGGAGYDFDVFLSARLRKVEVRINPHQADYMSHADVFTCRREELPTRLEHVLHHLLAVSHSCWYNPADFAQRAAA